MYETEFGLNTCRFKHSASSLHPVLNPYLLSVFRVESEKVLNPTL